ncbi:MAG: pseudouridine synthase [Candidatus Nitrosopelagicus sp.]|nr:pseudouridine synthase [Candidatus Nitrosopelagicus sp.]
MRLHSENVSEILKNYDLCEYCTGRIISKIVGKPQSKFLGKKYLKKLNKFSNKCYICKNIFDTFDNMLSNVIEKSSYFDFKTFHLGIILKPSLLERDDYIKSKFKIKGIENIKFGIAKELGKKISRRTNSTQVNTNPDLFIQTNFKDESCTLKAKPLFVYGRYNKKIRNIPQKQELCHNCSGIGCHNCEFKGLENIQSIESIISNLLITKFDCKQIKINWIGGEDQSSLVLGNGRPFFAKLLNPKKRNRVLRKISDLQNISLSELQKISVQPKGHVSFKSEVSVTIDTEQSVSLTQLKKLKILENTLIQDSSKDKNNSQKRIHKIGYKKTGKNRFILDLVVDGGVSIKFFIQKSETVPNISDLIKNRCKCVKFDFKNIMVNT